LRSVSVLRGNEFQSRLADSLALFVTEHREYGLNCYDSHADNEALNGRLSQYPQTFFSCSNEPSDVVDGAEAERLAAAL
jgi:hypothetical protein